ncbi:MAG: inositol monophosphatase family protein [Promethearchaeota archaeon]
MVQNSRESKLAIKLGIEASVIPEWFRKKGFQFFEKNDNTPVTLADLATQIYIINSLMEEFPDDNIIAEEEGTIINEESKKIISKCFQELNIEINNIKEIVNYRGKASNRQWTIDPIDGTQGFVKGLFYAIGIGFMEDSVPMTCAISVPSYDKRGLALFSAERGKGAHASYGRKSFISIKASKKANVPDFVLYQSLHYDMPWVSQVAQNLKIHNSIKIDSMLKFCKVADGSADLYIKPIDPQHSFSWDYMPGILIIEEAGGKITDIRNEPLWIENERLRWTAPGIVASNGIAHDFVIQEIKKVT